MSGRVRAAVALAVLWVWPCAAGDDARATDALCDLAAFHLDRGDYARAMQVARQAVETAERSGDPSRVARARATRGDALFYFGEFDSALDDYRFALSKYRDLGDGEGEANQLRNVGVALKYLGEFEEALRHLDDAAALLRLQREPRTLPSVLDNLGGAYVLLGEPRRALECYEESLTLGRTSRNDEAMHHTLLRMGSLYLDEERPDRALPLLEEALAISRRLGLPPQEIWALSAISGALAALGRLDEALEVQERALRLDRELGNELQLAYRFLDLGTLHLERDPHLALEYLEQALDLYTSARFPITWNVRAEMARAYRRLGDLDAANEAFARAVDELESLRGRIVSTHYRTTFRQRHRRVYEEWVETLFEGEQHTADGAEARRAFAVVERARARALLEALTEARIGPIVVPDPGLKRREGDVDAQIAGLQARLASDALAPADRRQIDEELTRLEARFVRHVTESRRGDPRYASLRYPEPISADEAQRLVDPGSAALSFFVTPRAVFAFVLTSERFAAHRLEVAPSLVEARVQTYVELLSGGVAGASRDVGRRLYMELLAPLERDLPESARHLIVVPDGRLHELPFETLPRGRTDGPESGRERLLIEDHAISYAPSLTVLAALRVAPSIGVEERADLLVLADPVLPAAARSSAGDSSSWRRACEEEGFELSPMPFAAEEARLVARSAHRGSEIHVGEEASEHRVKTANLERFRVVHFATHGLVSRRSPLRSALVLTAGGETPQDGFLQVREIHRLRMASDLVVLSGCQTARGPVFSGEGVQGLARAFLHAGARSVVASLWSVNDEHTARFMSRFYRALASGESKAEALRSAKLEMLRSDRTSPRHWAPFVLIGSATDSLALDPPRRRLQRGALAAGLLLLLGLGVWSARRFGAGRP